MYAKHQVEHAEQQRLVTPIIGWLILAIPVWSGYALKENSDFLSLDEQFLLGVAFGKTPDMGIIH